MARNKECDTFPGIRKPEFFAEFKCQVNRKFNLLPVNNTGMLHQNQGFVQRIACLLQNRDKAYILKKRAVVIILGRRKDFVGFPVLLIPSPHWIMRVRNNCSSFPEIVIYPADSETDKQLPGKNWLQRINKYNSVYIGSRKVLQVF